MTGKHVDQYYAHCWFLSWKVLETKQIIKPDTFLILGTKKTEVYVKSTTPFQLASSSSGINGGGLSAIEYTTTLTIASETQPDIRQFVCNHWEDPHDAQHLTVAEIRQAMGEIVTLKLHDPVATK